MWLRRLSGYFLHVAFGVHSISTRIWFYSYVYIQCGVDTMPDEYAQLCVLSMSILPRTLTSSSTLTSDQRHTTRTRSLLRRFYPQRSTIPAPLTHMTIPASPPRCSQRQTDSFIDAQPVALTRDRSPNPNLHADVVIILASWTQTHRGDKGTATQSQLASSLSVHTSRDQGNTRSSTALS